MPITNDALTQDELDYLVYATLSETVANKDEMIPLNRPNMPTFNWFMAKAKKKGDPIRGGYRFNVKGLRGQKYTWWDGMDLLPFEERYTGTQLKFYVGKGHMGDILPFDFVERTGIRIDYERGIRQGAATKEAVERVVNVIKENADDIKFNRSYEMAKHIWKSNVDSPKCFTGIDGLLPVTNPTGGTIGGLPRSSPELQHVVLTGITGDTVMLYFQDAVRKAQRKANGRQVDYLAVGDNFYDLLVNVFSGATSAGGPAGTAAGKFDYRSARDKAMAKGEKMNIALPQDCFMYEDKMIVLEPMFAELNAEDPTSGWLNRCYGFTSDYLFVIPVLADKSIVHPIPYNQRVQYTSWHDEMTLACVHPNSQFVLTTSYNGTGIW